MTKPRHSIPAETNRAGTVTTIRCHVCAAGVLVVRENGMTGHTFLSCSTWPSCDGTAEIVLLSPGQQTLL